MTRSTRPALVEMAAVLFSASLIFASGATASAPSLGNSFQSERQLCPVIKARPKLMSLPRMVSPAQFCQVPSGRDTSKALKNCWENYLRDPEGFRKQLPACSTTPEAKEDFAAQEDSATIPTEMFHFLSTAAR